jgi:hypothetical protein
MTEYGEARVIDVLLVEDDEGDVLMTREAFEYYKIQNPLHVVSDGEQAMQFLHRTGPYTDAPRPGSSCSTSTCPGAAAWRCWPS